MIKHKKLQIKIVIFIYILLNSTLIADELVMTLDDCLKVAFEKNRRLEISKIQIQIAQNRYEQVLSSFYPIINAKLGGFYINKGYQFKSPASVINLDPQYVDLQSTALAQSQLSLQGVSVETVGQDNYLAALNTAKSQIASNISGLQIEEQSHDITSEWTGTGSLDVMYPLYTGGKRSSYKKIQKMGVENSRISNDQTVMDVMFDIKKLYFLSVMTQELNVTVNTLIEEMNVSLEIIEKAFKTDKNLDISKADYLKHKLAVEQIKLIKMHIDKNKRDLSRTLAFVVGIGEDAGITPKSVDLSEFPLMSFDLNGKMIDEKIISFNPDWKTLEKTIRMQEENIKISKSDYYPTIALIGNFGFLENNKNIGNVWNIDERNYSVGLVMEIPIFNGFLTKKKISEKKLELLALTHQSLLIKDALKMEVVNLLNQLNSIVSEIKSIEENYLLSLELVEAENMAYTIDKKKWEDLLSAQAYRSFISAQLTMKKFERLVLQNKLGKLIGNELIK